MIKNDDLKESYLIILFLKVVPKTLKKLNSVKKSFNCIHL